MLVHFFTLYLTMKGKDTGKDRWNNRQVIKPGHFGGILKFDSFDLTTY